MADMEECQLLNNPHIVERDDLKRRMEAIVARLRTSGSPSFIKDKISELKGYLKSLEKTDKSILSNILKFKSLNEFYVSERNSMFDYKLDLEEQIATLSDNLTKPNTPSIASEDSETPFSNSTVSPNSNVSDRTVSSLNLFRSAKEPPIQIGKFEGDEADKLAFSRFLSKFKAVIDGNPVYTNEEKLIHLISNLGDVAYEMIKHLSPEGSNYTIALNILKNEFLDRDFIKKKIIVRLLDISPPSEDNLVEVKSFLNEVKALAYDLKSYGLDFLAPDLSLIHISEPTRLLSISYAVFCLK